MTLRDETPILPAHIEQTVQAIAELHARHFRKASQIQRVVDRMTRFIGRPRFIAVLTLMVLAWMGLNLAIRISGHPAPDPPPFNYLQDVTEVLGLYITALILITQRHEDQMAEHREQLTLELAILSEQKSAKIIQLLEEMRRDDPSLANRRDLEAEALASPADPQAVLDAILDSQSAAVADTLFDRAAEETR